MQFLLFDVSATLVFLCGYVAAVAFLRRRTLAVMAATGPAPRGTQLPAPARRERKSQLPQLPVKERPTEQCCREWPRLSAPR